MKALEEAPVIVVTETLIVEEKKVKKAPKKKIEKTEEAPAEATAE